MIPSRLKQIRTGLLRRLWAPQRAGGGRLEAAALRVLRIGHCVLRDLAAGQLTLQAMSLVYTTLLALVPLLAVSFSVLKAFGVHNQAEPLLLNFLRPLGERGVELTGEIIAWVEQMQVGVLGSVGLALLVYSVIALIQKIESGFNESWHIVRRQRLSQRLGDYLSVILIGPVLIFAALGITARVMSTRLATSLLRIEPLGALVRAAGQLAPYLLVIAAFTLVYLYVPNTRVRLASAFTGAAVAGVLWQSLGWLFASIVVGSARFSAVTSGLTIVLIFMIWLYLNWLILLLGASVAFYHQHPEYMGLDPRALRLSGRLREKLGLVVMFLVARRHFRGESPWTVDALAQEVRLPSDAVGRILDTLEEAGLLAVSGEKDEAYLPARALEKIRLEDVLEAIRSADEGPLLNVGRLPDAGVVDELEAAVSAAVQEALCERTLRDLVLEDAGGEPVAEAS